jgi:thioredoxin 1
MKKISIIAFSLFILVFSSCNSVGGNKNEGIATETNEGVVNRLDTQMFKKLVWDFQKSPETWTFKGDLPCIIDFYADWCRPCKMVAPIMDELAIQYKGKVNFYKVNTDQEPDLSRQFNIRSIPALLYVPKNGKPQMTVGLSSKESYIQQINTILLAAEPATK